jgi:hypothetical protein
MAQYGEEQNFLYHQYCRPWVEHGRMPSPYYSDQGRQQL